MNAKLLNEQAQSRKDNAAARGLAVRHGKPRVAPGQGQALPDAVAGRDWLHPLLPGWAPELVQPGSRVHRAIFKSLVGRRVLRRAKLFSSLGVPVDWEFSADLSGYIGDSLEMRPDFPLDCCASAVQLLKMPCVMSGLPGVKSHKLRAQFFGMLSPLPGRRYRNASFGAIARAASAWNMHKQPSPQNARGESL
jgi:hypothetical protein